MYICAQSCPILCDPMDYSPLGFPVHGIFQARILGWVTISYSRDLPDPGIELQSLAMAGGFFPTRATWKALLYFTMKQKLMAVILL